MCSSVKRKGKNHNQSGGKWGEEDGSSPRQVVVVERPPAEDGDDAHHLRAADGLANPALVLPRQLRLAPPLDLAHVGDKVGHERRVLAFVEGVKLELVEDVLVPRRACVGPEDERLAPPLVFVVLVARETFWLDELGRA